MLTITLFGRTYYLSKEQWLLAAAVIGVFAIFMLVLVYQGLHKIHPWLFAAWAFSTWTLRINGTEYAIIPHAGLRMHVAAIGIGLGTWMYLFG